MLAAKLHAEKLAATVADDLVHVHVELRAAASHPYMQRKHVAVLSGQNLVAGLNDQIVDFSLEASIRAVCPRRRLFQKGQGADHFNRHDVFADAEMLNRALRLRPPQLVRRHLDVAEAVGFDSNGIHSALQIVKPVREPGEPWPRQHYGPAKTRAPSRTNACRNEGSRPLPMSAAAAASAV